MQKLIYLSNGQQAYLVETLPNGKFLVDPLNIYVDHEGNEFDDASGAYRIEDAIFDKAPKAKIDTELLEAQLKLKDARTELSTIQSEKNIMMPQNGYLILAILGRQRELSSLLRIF